MTMQPSDQNSIAVTEFKAHCLSVIDGVATGKTGPVVLTKRNRPVVVIMPIESDMPDLWGAMRGSVTVAPGTDLTAGTFALLDADA